MKDFATPQFVITVLMLGLVAYVLVKVFETGTLLSNDVQVMVITAVVITTLQELRKHWLNSTADSEEKNKTIAQQARTAAAAQDALLDPAVTFTGPAKQQSALLPGEVPAVQPTSEVKV